MELQEGWKRLAAGNAFTVDECGDLLRQVERLQRGLAYLASCQAATAEGLTKSTSKSDRKRHVELTRMAGEFVVGNVMSIRHPITVAAAKERCERVVAEAQAAEASATDNKVVKGSKK